MTARPPHHARGIPSVCLAWLPHPGEPSTTDHRFLKSIQMAYTAADLRDLRAALLELQAAGLVAIAPGLQQADCWHVALTSAGARESVNHVVRMVVADDHEQPDGGLTGAMAWAKAVMPAEAPEIALSVYLKTFGDAGRQAIAKMKGGAQ